MPVEDILLNTISRDKRGEVSALAEGVQKRLLDRVVDSLSEDQQVEFLNILENNDSDKFQVFLGENVPNFFDWLEEEIKQVNQ